MAPRTYRLGRRGEAAEETRRRIVEATHALHGEQGFAATSMKQIAERAGVGLGTVYHHFPTYDDAIRACGAHAAATMPPPQPAEFADLPSPAARLRRLAALLFGWYERQPALARLRCERDRMPMLRPYAEAEEAHREAMVRAALGPLGRNARRVRLIAALLDPAVAAALRRGGLSAEAAAAEIAVPLLAILPPSARPPHSPNRRQQQ